MNASVAEIKEQSSILPLCCSTLFARRFFFIHSFNLIIHQCWAPMYTQQRDNGLMPLLLCGKTCARPNVYKTVNISTSGWEAHCRYVPIHNNSILFMYWNGFGGRKSHANHPFHLDIGFYQMQTTTICTCAIQSPKRIEVNANHNNVIRFALSNICVEQRKTVSQQTTYEKLRRLPSNVDKQLKYAWSPPHFR